MTAPLSLSDKAQVFTLKPSQEKFVTSTEQFPAYIGAIGTGKTSSMIQRAMILCQAPNNLGVIVRKNFVDLRDSTMRDFTLYTGVNISADTKEAKLPNGSVIMFRHGDEMPVLKNLNLGFFAIEQAEEFADSNTWDFLLMRLRRQVPFRSGFLVANANGHNWIWDKWVKHGPSKNHATIEAKTVDFSDILPSDYIENLKAQLPANLYKRYVENSHEVTEGLVYNEWDEHAHLVDSFDIPAEWERGFVLDHGFRNPTAVLWYAIDFDGNVILYDEHYEREKPISYHAERVKARGVNQGWCDPSIFNKTQSKGGNIYSLADEYREYGVELMPSVREEEYARIARVNEMFKAGRIKVQKHLANFRQEIGNWKWKPQTQAQAGLNMKEEPEDRGNHLCLIGDTEVLTPDGYETLANLEDKQFSVWTPFGWREAKCIRTGNRTTQAISFQDGSEVVGTLEHPLLTINGWDRLEYINQGDILYGPHNYQQYDSRVSRQAVLLGRYSLLPKGSKGQADISEQMEVQNDLASSSRMGIGQCKNSQSNYARPSLERESKGQLPFKSRIGSYLGAYKSSYDVRGEAGEVKASGEVGRQIRSYLAQVERGTSLALDSRKGEFRQESLSGFQVPSLRDTIQIERPTKENNVLRTELPHEGLPQKRVVRKRQAQSQSVYALAVEGKAFYLSNGVISHNCDDLGYLVASRFPAATKPIPNPTFGSLDYYDNHLEKTREARRPRGIW